MSAVSDVLSRLMMGMSESELARVVKVPKATINRLLSNRTPDPRVNTLAPIAQYFGITIEQLLGLVPLPDKSPLNAADKTGHIATVPFIDFNCIDGWAAGKHASEANHNVLINNPANAADLYLTKVCSQAMLPKFQEGAFLLVNRKLEASHEDFVIYKTLNGILFRQLIVESNQKYLCSLHSGFEAIKIEKDALYLGLVIESKLYLK